MNKTGPKNKQVTSTCITCGTTFIQYRSSQKFCDRPCKNKHHYAKRAAAWNKIKSE